MPGPFFTAVFAGTNKTFGLGFNARSVIVDNPTSRFIFLPEANQYIPPYVVGAVVQYNSASASPNVVWQTPPGITAATLVATQQALLKFCEESLPPTPGTPVTVPTVTAAPTIFNSSMVFSAAASPLALTIPTTGMVDGDVMLLFVHQYNGGGGFAPTLATPTDWTVTTPALTNAGAVQLRSSYFQKVWHPGMTSVSLVFTNSTNLIASFIILRNSRTDALIVDNPGGLATTFGAAAFALPGRLLSVGAGGFVIYEVCETPVLTISSATLTGGQSGLVLVNSLSTTNMIQGIWMLPMTLIELSPTMTATFSAGSSAAHGMTLPIPHA